MTVEFQAFPKIPRLFRDIVITEKIDGTNAAVGVTDDGEVYAQSRKRLITPDDDNFGFAHWVSEHADELRVLLGPGLHFGEWWGSGIQRGYGLQKGEKRFSLFNVKRWAELEPAFGLGVVPVLYEGPNDEAAVRDVVEELRQWGSRVTPGFMDPEGIIVYHTASNHVYKVTLENDESPKALVRS